ncbi:MAG: FAD-dependent oxidoreductase [Planctomycetota bacterium]|nr:FAD-dependent oxidoreductase [Planctomycetota bacterium]
MASTCDVLIGGGGVTGLSTALHLALRKCGRIRVLERHYVGAGQSGRGAGIIRSMVRHAGLSRWQAESARFFQNLGEQFGEGIPVHAAGYLLATDRITPRASMTLPWMRQGFVHRTFACTYDYSPDGMPILDRLEGLAGIYFAAGFSGGGFSLSPFVGRTMAEYIAIGRRPDDIAELSWQRFRDGKTIQWSNN